MNWPRKPAPQRLIALAQARYGTQDTDWYELLADDVGVHRTTVWRWATGRVTVPPLVLHWLENEQR